MRLKFDCLPFLRIVFSQRGDVVNKGYPDDWDWLEGPIPDSPVIPPKRLVPNAITIEVKHIGGERRTIEVIEATEDGVLHVRWGELAGMYAIHVFRTIQDRGFAHLYRTPKSRIPLPWQAVEPKAARALWQRMTGRNGKREWKADWSNGQRKWIPK
jgi:hypothetical protein